MGFSPYYSFTICWKLHGDREGYIPLVGRTGRKCYIYILSIYKFMSVMCVNVFLIDGFVYYVYILREFMNYNCD